MWAFHWIRNLFELFDITEGITLEFRNDRLMVYPTDPRQFLSANVRSVVVLHKRFFSSFALVGEPVFATFNFEQTVRLVRAMEDPPFDGRHPMSITVRITKDKCQVFNPHIGDCELDITTSSKRPPFLDKKNDPSTTATFSAAEGTDLFENNMHELMKERRKQETLLINKKRRFRFSETVDNKLSVTSNDPRSKKLVMFQRDGTTALTKQFVIPFPPIIYLYLWCTRYGFKQKNVLFLMDSDRALFEFSNSQKHGVGISAKLLVRGRYF